MQDPGSGIHGKGSEIQGPPGFLYIARIYNTKRKTNAQCPSRRLVLLLRVANRLADIFPKTNYVGAFGSRVEFSDEFVFLFYWSQIARLIVIS